MVKTYWQKPEHMPAVTGRACRPTRQLPRSVSERCGPVKLSRRSLLLPVWRLLLLLKMMGGLLLLLHRIKVGRRERLQLRRRGCRDSRRRGVKVLPWYVRLRVPGGRADGLADEARRDAVGWRAASVAPEGTFRTGAHSLALEEGEDLAAGVAFIVKLWQG